MQATAKTVVRAEVWRERMGSLAVKKEDMNKYGCGGAHGRMSVC